MREMDILVTVFWNDDVVEESTIEWTADKLGEEFTNIGYDWDDLNTSSTVTARR